MHVVDTVKQIISSSYWRSGGQDNFENEQVWEDQLLGRVFEPSSTLTSEGTVVQLEIVNE